MNSQLEIQSSDINDDTSLSGWYEVSQISGILR